MKSFTALIALLVTFAVSAAPPVRPSSSNAPVAKPESKPINHVILISIDGLRSDALMVAPEKLSGFARLMTGAYTLNARTDPDYTNTLPNHFGMMTSRTVNGDSGHLWNTNSLEDEARIVHHKAGRYVASMFDVAHDHGVHTALLGSKAKFIVFDMSYDNVHGGPDTIGDDNGRDKIDIFSTFDSDITPDFGDNAVTELALSLLEETKGRTLQIFHYTGPDGTGHAHGWNLSPQSEYMQSVYRIDEQINHLLDAIESSPEMRGITAVILTSDHGGGSPHHNHGHTHMWVNYIIPLFVWTGDDRARGDLYEINKDSRLDPGIRNPQLTNGAQPIRNSDAGNLALSLLGLPAIPGSTVNVRQDLRVSAADQGRRSVDNPS